MTLVITSKLPITTGAETLHDLTHPPLYPGQFVLGSGVTNAVRDWKQVAIAGAFALRSQSELPVVQLTDDRKRQQLTLVGNILDPHVPAARNEDIVRRLLDGFTTRSSLINATTSLGGRWVLIAEHGAQRFLFHDALGLRQVFYTDRALTGVLWAMSQPGLVAEILGLTIDPAAQQFMDSDEFRVDPEYRWPGASSPFTEIKRLLPNHYLDLATGVAHRYWPDSALPEINAEQAFERVSSLLQGLLKAASARFDLVMGLTAGLDSRVVLAASREIVDKLSFVSVQQQAMAEDHPDLTIPSKLLMLLGLPHKVVRAAGSMSPQFNYYFKHSVFLAHDHYGPDAEALWNVFGRRMVALTGSGAEVGRCSFRRELPMSDRRKIRAEHLARLQRMGNHEFALRHFTSWLEDVGDSHNVKLLDLFEWEQGHGSWLAMTQLEFDIAWQDIFTPFNCRDVLTTLLSVDERHRRVPDYALFQRLIEKLWPDVLQEPINPQPRQSLLQLLKGAVRSLPNYWS